MEYIYKISFYENNRCKNPYSNMYYLNPEHTKWAFNTNQIAKIFYIRVPTNSNEHLSAIHNSEISDNKNNNVQVD